jgi:two-component system secretion response regulator SsrB
MHSVGKGSKEIGAELNISVRTVETLRVNMMRKLRVHSVTELLHRVRPQKLIGVRERGKSVLLTWPRR